MTPSRSVLSSCLESLPQLDVWTGLANLAALWVLYRVVLALYNISPLHPLYKFPGPRLAALSYAYEAYFDFWLGGRYTWEIQRLHQQYGHIIRINPDELHCDDPSFLDEIYAGGNRIRDKWQHFVNTSNSGPTGTGTFATVPHEIHRRRRMALARYFSRGQMLKLENEVHALAHRMADKMLGMKNSHFNIREAFNCFTADIIAKCCFGEDMGFVGQPGTWEPNFATWTFDFLSMIYWMRHVPPMRIVAEITPLAANIMGGSMKSFMDQMSIVIPGYIQKAKDDKNNGRIFADLIESPYLPEEDKTIYRLTGEGFTLLTAGTETTAAALTGIAYYLLAQPATFARLVEDLEGVDPENLKWTALEQRPYLWAVIQEALRLFPGISPRSARIAREETLVYQDADDQKVRWTIPRGTPVGMSSTIQHHNKDLFPGSWQFRPERWLLDDGQPNYALEKHLLAFSKGSRQCLGMQLALCELYIVVATLALRVFPRAELYRTTEEDVRYDSDLVVPQPKKGTKGVRVIIT